MNLFFKLICLFAFSFDAAFGRKKMTPSMMIPGKCLETDLPYHVDVRYDGKHKCSGSLVKSEKGVVVVTAASCVQDGEKDKYSLSLFTNQVRWDGPRHELEEKLSIIDFKTYEKFDKDLLNNDIAVIIVNQTISKKSEFLELLPAGIELPKHNNKEIGGIIAWDKKRQCMRNLKENFFIGNKFCLEKILVPLKMTMGSSMICSGTEVNPDRKMEYKCEGELGSPLVGHWNSFTPSLIGVISWTPEQPEQEDEDHNYPCVSTGLFEKDIIDWISKQ